MLCFYIGDKTICFGSKFIPNGPYQTNCKINRATKIKFKRGQWGMSCASVKNRELKFQTSDFILLSWLVEVAILYQTKNSHASVVPRLSWLDNLWCCNLSVPLGKSLNLPMF